MTIEELIHHFKDQYGVYCVDAVELIESALRAKRSRYKNLYHRHDGKTFEQLRDEEPTVKDDPLLSHDNLTMKEDEDFARKSKKLIYTLDPYDPTEFLATLKSRLAEHCVLTGSKAQPTKVTAIGLKHHCTNASGLLKDLNPILPTNEELAKLMRQLLARRAAAGSQNESPRPAAPSRSFSARGLNENTPATPEQSPRSDNPSELKSLLKVLESQQETLRLSQRNLFNLTEQNGQDRVRHDDAQRRGEARLDGLLEGQRAERQQLVGQVSDLIAENRADRAALGLGGGLAAAGAAANVAPTVTAATRTKSTNAVPMNTPARSFVAGHQPAVVFGQGTGDSKFIVLLRCFGFRLPFLTH